MLPLPRPYPDELVGSMLGRASRQTGVGLKMLIQQITGTLNTSHPATITRYHGVAGAFGFKLEEFLSDHTLYPYATAFWQREDRDTVTQNLLDPDVSVKVSFLTQNSGKTVNSLRLCPDCVADDVRHYGESYWRRAHQLPGLSYCVEHEGLLRETKAGLNQMLKTPPPHQVSITTVSTLRLERHKALKLAQISEAALNARWHFPNPSVEYRKRAMNLGYGLSGTDLCTHVLSRDFQAFYGAAFLEGLGCEVRQVNRPWVSSLVGTMHTNWTALRHVLVLAFLESNPSPSRNPRDHITRKKPRHVDWSALEKTAIKGVQQRIVSHEKAGTRTTVKALLTEAGIFRTYSHNRQRFESLSQVLVEFQASPQSERQTGRRPRVYVSVRSTPLTRQKN